jgi:hypothetical protein
VLPDTTLFIVANQAAMIFNWRTNTERRLPNIPNGVRVTLVFFRFYVWIPAYGPLDRYPFQGAGTLLPQSYQDDFSAAFLTCGGSNVSDTVSLALVVPRVQL